MITLTRAACLCGLADLSATALAATALAQAPAGTAAEAAVLTRVIDMLCVDLLDRGRGCERVVLLQSAGAESTADLLILEEDTGATDRPSVITARGIVFSGPFDGQRPWLEAGAEGTLLLHSEQFAVGRTPWTETLSIRALDGELTVIASSFSMLDRPAGGDLSCDVDLVTGNWRVQAQRSDPETGAVTRTWDEAGTASMAPPPIGEWNARPTPAQCDGVISEWFSAAP